MKTGKTPLTETGFLPDGRRYTKFLRAPTEKELKHASWIDLSPITDEDRRLTAIMFPELADKIIASK